MPRDWKHQWFYVSRAAHYESISTMSHGCTLHSVELIVLTPGQTLVTHRYNIVRDVEQACRLATEVGPHGRTMPQIFHPSMNTISRATIFGAVFIIAFIIWLLAAIARSPYATSAGVIKEQPVPFSHEHHVSDCGIDCRYCHTSVEQSSFAGIPPTQTCMNCHSHLWTESPILSPVRASFRSGEPLVWNRVHDLPDFARFDHSIHVRKGVSCVTCHGDVDQMPLMHRESTLHMEWCLECHREPERFVGPRELVFASAANPADQAPDQNIDWVDIYHVKSKTDCSVCHY